MSRRRNQRGHGVVSACALVLALFSLSSVAGQPATYWRTEIVSLDAVRIGDHPGLAVAQDGTLHAAWDHYAGGTDLRVYVAELREGIWITTLLNSSAHSPTLAVDASGNPHVLFESLSDSKLVYATKQGGVWVYELADSLTGGFPDVEIDSSGHVHVIHDAPNADCIAYLVRTAPGIWIRELATCDSRGTLTDLAIGPDDNPHFVSSYTSGIVFRGVRANDGWSFEEIGYGGSPTVAVDASSVAHVAYITNPLQLMHAERLASGWSAASVPGSAQARSTSIAVDSAGNPHISYEQFGLDDPNSGHQRYAARQADGSWTNALVDPEGNAEQSIIRVDKTDTPRLLYYYFIDQVMGGDLLRYDLRYAEPLTAVPSRLVT